MQTLNRLLAKASGYKYQVNFEQNFVDGLLYGKTYPGYLRFATWKDANDFCAKCDGKTVVRSCTKTSNYTMSNPVLEAI